MKTEQFKNEVLEIFKKSKEKTLLITSDGHVFKTKDKGFCKQHCDLNGIAFKEQTASDFEKDFKKEEIEAVSGAVDFSKLEEMSQPELNKLATSLGVASDSRKKVDLIEALNKYQDELERGKPEPNLDEYSPVGATEDEDVKADSDKVESKTAE